jgi:hypothetical protein
LNIVRVIVGIALATVFLHGRVSGQVVDTTALARLEAIWNEAHVRGDAQALERLWADDLEINVPSMPPMSKAEALNFARSGRMRFDRYETSELKYRVFGGTAVVSGRLRRTRTVGGQTVDDDWRFTKVYVVKDGLWRVVAFHASPAAS